MRGWEQSHIDKLRSRGMVATTQIQRDIIPHKKPITGPKPEAKPLSEIKQILKYMEIDFESEYKFLQERKFKFDIALPSIKLAIEYEGLFSDKSRHTNVVGYSNDCTKYNLAVMAGWKVLRYTQLTYQQFLSDINKII